MSRHKSGKFCNHYRAMSEHDTCEVGVPYDKFNGMKFNERPCFRDSKDEAVRCGCELMEFPTPEEVAAWEKEMNERFNRTITARKAIVDHLGGPWKKGMQGASGNIPCPVCKTGQLGFSRSGYNGHIHAACKTEGCVSWME